MYVLGERCVREDVGRCRRVWHVGVGGCKCADGVTYRDGYAKGSVSVG